MGKKQFAALPFRLDNSELRVMLITTRRKRRWSVPKGSPMRNKEPHLTAALEAYEEAGLVGIIATRAMGSFKHRKRKGDRKRTMDVAVFPMKVHGQERWWPEKGEREATWVSAETAARLVHKAELRRLIARFAAQTEKGCVLAAERQAGFLVQEPASRAIIQAR
ncbi:NUDIX hydrolase [Bradyrhizobium sp. 180]|uniref:NUDIX hydrolase n=1 Tax=unclassified Bradyrhizobium TaxID=2631580 RepID=UPI001FF82E6D|nr:MULTISPECIES: NUDIX hydrolase [unclassified Bradyrhizobium]MCK1421266.1 NUDIX hydrolase [Bradyrhizobium sp. CW12]MCK1489530.1 NUDIX hydrolase [Bradyrhizobium sp. 180]MCK1526813.1 NUDIX hydrolase [Bradyrhizobium sp. 182]MCK1599746.1 NUDIX hydrolase [Bradyrhizobium sp. 164]MCK1617109.1 NUDIX hydrolase [Bradyrhizobium sp. 159]